MGVRTRVIAAVVAALTMSTVTGAAVAAAEPGRTATLAATGDQKPGGGKEKPKDGLLAKVAASLKVSVSQLVTALDHLKAAIDTGTPKEEAVAAFAKELDITVADAEKALAALSGDAKHKPGAPDEAVKLLAAELHISVARARQVFKDLAAVESKGKEIVSDPAFVAIAKSLGISPQRLLDVLIKVKEQIAGGVKK